MTDAELQAIRQRCEKATRGPWVVGVSRGWNETGWPVFRLRDMVSGDAAEAEAVRDFIEHARADIPALLAEVQRLRQQQPLA